MRSAEAIACRRRPRPADRASRRRCRTSRGDGVDPGDSLPRRQRRGPPAHRSSCSSRTVAAGSINDVAAFATLPGPRPPLCRSARTIRPALSGATPLCLHVDVDDRSASRSKPTSRVASAKNVRAKRPAATTSVSDKRDLRDDQAVANAEAAIGGDAAALLLDRFVRRDSAEADAGASPKTSAVALATSMVNAEHAPIERQVEIDAIASRSRAARRAAGCSTARRARPSAAPAADRMQRLGEQLPGEPQPRRAKRQANAQLVAPRDGARQQQVGDIGAGNQQHEADDDEDCRQGLVRSASAERRSGPLRWR